MVGVGVSVGYGVGVGSGVGVDVSVGGLVRQASCRKLPSRPQTAQLGGKTRSSAAHTILENRPRWLIWVGELI